MGRRESPLRRVHMHVCVFIELIFSAKILKLMKFLPNELNFLEESRRWLYREALISAEE